MSIRKRENLAFPPSPFPLPLRSLSQRLGRILDHAVDSTALCPLKAPGRA